MGRGVGIRDSKSRSVELPLTNTQWTGFLRMVTESISTTRRQAGFGELSPVSPVTGACCVDKLNPRTDDHDECDRGLPPRLGD
ncbi:hypothetical protein PV646_19130 [Streptomyces sp. ID05-26A]|nr:hypothetical protein [Streptomyces sp. ID05-26A]